MIALKAHNIEGTFLSPGGDIEEVSERDRPGYSSAYMNMEGPTSEMDQAFPAHEGSGPVTSRFLSLQSYPFSRTPFHYLMVDQRWSIIHREPVH